jgi:predicted nucleic acid-binding protein
MAIVLDTSVVIDHLRGNPGALAAMRDAARSGERLAASVLTKTEILAGMRPKEEPATRALLDTLNLVDVDEGIAERAGALANQYLKAYPGVDTVDYVVAATAQELGARLWTKNIKHFPMFPDLVAPY